MLTQSRPLPPGNLPLGKNLEEVKALGLACIFVIQKAIALRADGLASRVETNSGDRLASFDAFVGALVREARNAPLDGFLDKDEQGGKAALVKIIQRVAKPPRSNLRAA